MFYVAVHAFLVKDGKVLLLQRKNTGYRDGEYSVPAGHVDGGEAIVEAMKRELMEEVGIRLLHNPAVSHVMHRRAQSEERIDYFYKITHWSGQPINVEPEKCAGLSWYDVNDLPLSTIPYIRFALHEISQDRLFSEFIETD